MFESKIHKISISDNIKLDFFDYKEYSDSNPDVFLNSKYVPSFDINTKFLVTFDKNNLISKGNVYSSPGYDYTVYKKKKDDLYLEYVGSVKSYYLQLALLDMNIKNNETYQYYVFQEADGLTSEAAISDEITVCWDDWSICDIQLLNQSELTNNAIVGFPIINDNLTYWSLNLNLASSSQGQTMDNTVYTNLSQFPQMSTGNANYANGSITCLLGDINKVESGEVAYIEPERMLNDFKDFCANGRPKFLRDRKGHSMIVGITGFSAQVNDEIPCQPTTITFNWAQLRSTEDLPISIPGSFRGW